MSVLRKRSIFFFFLEKLNIACLHVSSARCLFSRHPDRKKQDSSAQERFIEIKQAYELLMDPQRRREFDRHGWTEDTPNFRRRRAEYLHRYAFVSDHFADKHWKFGQPSGGSSSIGQNFSFPGTTSIHSNQCTERRSLCWPFTIT